MRSNMNEMANDNMRELTGDDLREMGGGIIEKVILAAAGLAAAGLCLGASYVLSNSGVFFR
jgi:hypothetical protein